ncbi:serine/threonine-protein kinase Nek1 [Drosophila grimshawi]|uniref:non-specific serine/threonine protein kinase n=1 Tax=Drosophila grimshawi TaxID=7222 RepID=B4JLN7_DROGR|nr:serine/threonine-protein kinase Nek1 [Drosophila grimshawi]EDV91648.1 GH24478 [Drosophila grimshawi]
MSLDRNSEEAATKMSPEFAKKTLQDYEVLAVMGNGAFGTCYKVKDKTTGVLYAWKGMNYDDLDDERCESLISEISVLRQLQHPNIVQYYHHLVNREAKSIYIVMECCDGGDLAQLIQRARTQRQRFEEPYIWRVLFQLCRALQVCHNKIPNGTILHRDIKPANIFLDAAGNVKLGDFGLARVLRREQSFAASFVGTPHYMSPELVKGRKYDRKSDVWAVGCLIYELCALRPPFRGRAFAQLSDNIAHGQFSRIPDVYSKDLQSIIGYMLAVDHEQRPGIEVITRHPLLVRNINEISAQFPTLVDAGDEFDVPGMGKLFPDSPELSSTVFTEQYSFNEGYGQRRLSVTGVFTPDLRSELFYSAKRRIFANGKQQQQHQQLQQSDPALYESIKREPSPRRITQNIFDDALQQRLHAIRAQESLLEQRASELEAEEQRLKQLERQLLHKLEQAEQQQQQQQQQQCSCRLVAPSIPPVPPRRPAAIRCHDDTYCSIELNDTSPTVAKMNLALLTAPKQLLATNNSNNNNNNTLRKVTFQSPAKVSKSAAAAVPVPVPVVLPMQMSVSSTESGDSHASSTRRKSILSLFGLSRAAKVSSSSVKQTAAQPQQQQQMQQQEKQRRAPLATKLPATQQQQQQQQPQSAQQQQQQLTNMWTKEQKRAAFDLLAAMNAADKDAVGPVAGARRQQLRQSVRERNSSMQRNRLRRSMVQPAKPLLFGSGSGSREQMLI